MIETIDDVLADFEFLDEWDDKYRYVIELGRTLTPLPEEAYTEATMVQGCVSQVWLISERDQSEPPRLTFVGDSDAHIVKGLIAILLLLFNNKTAREILRIDAKSILSELELDTHLTPQRSNGLFSMLKRIRKDAEDTLKAAEEDTEEA